MSSIHPSAVIDDGASIGRGTRIWHFCHVSRGAIIGEGVVLGQNVFVAPGVRIGNNVRVQNNVSLYDGVVLEDDVFCGPSCVFTNGANPRAAISRKGSFVSTRVRRGATIGANATIVCGTTIGRHAFVGAGAVVARSEVPDYALMLGVPARHVGWMSRHGERLEERERETMICPASGLRYALADGKVSCLDLDEDAPLPGSTQPEADGDTG